MTPAARIQAAIDILDRVLSGEAAERALTGWARGSRFAGSGDRAAVRDLVYDALRRRRSLTARAGAGVPSGRALLIGVVADEERATLFAGLPHGPAPLSAAEIAALQAVDGDLPDPVRLDYPDWLDGPLRSSLGADFTPVMAALQDRAPVYLRANPLRGPREAALHALAEAGIEARPHDLAETAIEVTGNAGRIRGSSAYLDGLVELQDLSSQAAVACLPLQAGMRILDYCAGGGGKALAMAARTRGAVDAHDVAPARMRDLPARARRAGADIRLVPTRDLRPARYDLVLVDAPCSGSGTWRRTPEAKWLLTPGRLAELTRLQTTILAEAARYLKPGGVLAYMTCSLLDAENSETVRAFLKERPDFRCSLERCFLPLSEGDGFFVAVLPRS